MLTVGYQEAPSSVYKESSPLETPTDDQLMARFCAGEEIAFDMLYQRHASPARAFLRSMVHDATLADDLLQTTFLSVVRARGRYQPGTAVRAWIFAIAANAGRDALRRRRARREDLDDVRSVSEAAADVPEPRDPGASRAVEDALMRLPVGEREAVVLHKLHELSFDEVGAALGISAGAAKVRAHRGYKRLRDLLAPLGEAT